mgnify:CR=1 FL=1
MKRRDFIKKAGLASAAAFVAPYILPSGRLFARTGTRKVNHVVFCLFAGGIRNIESVNQGESNLMVNMLNDVSGGFTPQTGIDQVLPVSPIGSSRLQDFGTLYKEFRFKEGSTGHYSGHVTAMTGRYHDSSLNLRANPPYPTIFEYYRKHNGANITEDATKSWWISDSLGPYPLLNYSTYPGYGAEYGANYIQATSLISNEGYNAIGLPKTFDSENDKLASELKGFCDGTFGNQFNAGQSGVINTPENKEVIKGFIDELFQDAISGAGYNSWGFGGEMNSDLQNIYYAEQVLKKFQPELTVLNLQDVDVCHSDFTGYCNNLRKADWGVAHLWNTIQSTPGLANDTVLICVPEHGRNISPNTLLDAYGRPAFDHTNDNTSREIFSLICGPSGVINQRKVVTDIEGESIDIVPTIANLLGFDTDIPSGLVQGNVLNSAMV